MGLTHFETFVRALEASADKQGSLRDEYVIFPPMADYGYDATPRNSLTFGAMGVDGVHYVILTKGGIVPDDSPVIQVSPMDSDAYRVLGESFIAFLARACDVSLPEMDEVIEKERSGHHTLLDFLKKRFQMSRLRERNRGRMFHDLLDMIVPKPTVDIARPLSPLRG